MRNSLESIGQRSVKLSDGTEIEADLVIVGVGVRPRVALAEAARLPVERGILVDAHLETAVPGIYAAGDAARWRDERSGEMRRVEHWVVAERQGQVAAENMLGTLTPFEDVPFFWSAHYDMTIRYIGYAQSWDDVEMEGS